MPVQVDEGGGAALLRTIEDMGLTVHTGVGTQEIVTDAAGAVTGMTLSDGSDLATDLVVFSAGVRPRDQLARDCGSDGRRARRHRGRRAVPHRDDPHVFAIGECALAADGRVYGLVAPGYEHGRDGRRDHRRRHAEASLHRRRPVHQAEAARRGRGVLRRRARHGRGLPRRRLLRLPLRRRTRSWSSARTARCSAASWSATPRRTARCARSPAPSRRSPPSSWSCPPGAGGPPSARPVRAAGRGGDLLLPQRHQGRDPGAVTDTAAHRPRGEEVHQGRYGLRQLRQGARPAAHAELAATASRSTRACAAASRTPASELYEIVRALRITSYPQLLDSHGRESARGGDGCEVCKPAVGSIIASLAPDDRRRAATSWTASRPPSRTPTTTSSPTSRATARTRSCRASPAARSPRRS